MLKHNLPFLPLFAAMLLLGGLGAAPAMAHRLNIAAPVQGKSIAGEAYYADGNPARNARVSVFDPAGQSLGETTTDGEGRFAMPLRFRCDHRVVVDAGDGHTKTVTVSAKEIPATLPAWTGVAMPAAGDSSAPPTVQTPAEVPAQLAALEAQLAELRKEMARHENTVRFRDALGGIGWILGLAGLAFYFLGARRKERGTGEEHE